MAGDRRVDDLARTAAIDRGKRETFGAAEALTFDQDSLSRAEKCSEVTLVGDLARRAQPGGALLYDPARKLGHAGCRRALAWRERKDVEMGKPTFLDDFQRIAEHFLRFGRESRDDVSAEDDVGAQPPDILAKADGIVPEMAALHALQDHVVAGLQRQMQVRHQPRFRGNGVDEIVVRLDGIDRGKPKP